jgi:hypothetical protein
MKEHQSAERALAELENALVMQQALDGGFHGEEEDNHSDNDFDGKR